jgi:glyoxylase I family protein
VTDPPGGLHHVLLTVRDVDASAAWYEQVLGLTALKRFPADDTIAGKVVYRLATGSMVGLVAHRAGTGDGFDELRTGMDHLAFTVADSAALQRWAARLDELEIAHSAPAAAIGGEVIVFRDPDDIQLQLWAPASNSAP